MDFTLDGEDFLDSDIMEAVEQIDQMTQIIIPARVNEFTKAYGIIKKACNKTGLKVSFGIFEPLKSFGHIDIEGKKIDIDCTNISEAFSLANNIEIYPLTNNKIRITLTFHGLTKVVKEK